MSFLPKDYTLPESPSSFFKLQDGENRIRILSDAKVGWEGWKDSKPFRREGVECNIKDNEVDIDEKYSKKPKINLFWAFLVFNYKSNQVEVATITQKTVLKGIENLVNDPDWGDILKYDIAINKVKKGDKTTYTVSPKPAKELTAEIKKIISESKLSIDIIFGKGIEDDGKKIEYPEEDSSEVAF